MGWLGALLDRLRATAEPGDTAAAPAVEDAVAGRSPYREAGGVPGAGSPLTLARLPRFAGWEVVEALDGDGESYVRWRIKPPEAPSPFNDGASVHDPRPKPRAPPEPEHALACFAVDPTADEGWFAIAFDEARVSMRLAHRNLGRVVAMEADGGFWWHLCERPPGETLEGVLARVRYGAPPPGIDVLAAVFADFAAGLHAAHLHADDDGRPLGFRYADLGPSSLLLSRDGTGRVVDWGLATLVRAYRSRDSDPGGVTGDGRLDDRQRAGLRTLAPEQMRGQPFDGRADVFALGAMLHEACTGASPFLAGSDIETARRVLEHTPPPLSTLAPGAPPALDGLVQRALAKDPAARCTAGELCEGLRAVLAARGAGDPGALVAGYVEGLALGGPAHGGPAPDASAVR